MSNNSKAQQSSNKFNVKEYALNGVTDRKYFHKTNELPEVTGKKDIYTSHYDHCDEIIKYVKEHNNELIGYDGPVSISTIILDIDVENHLDEALEIGRNFLRHLEAEYELDLNSISINFSGNKGFHFRLPAELFGGFEPSEELPATIKAIAKMLTNGFDHFDNSIYDKTRIIRVLNTVNGKSGRYAIPLTSNEFFTLTIDEIIALASSAREVETLDRDEILENQSLVNLKNIKPLGPDKKNTDNNKDRAKVSLLLKGGLNSGQRHDGLLGIVSHLVYYGVPDDTIIELLKHWNNSNDPPKEESDLITEVKGVIKSYGDIKGHFWTIKRKKLGKSVLQISYSKYIDYLMNKGFSKLFLTKTYTFIKVNDNKMKEVIQPLIKDEVLFDIRGLSASRLPAKFKEELTDELIRKSSHYFGTDMLECVPTRDVELLKDTKDKGFVYYKNGYVEINKEQIVFRHYSELNGLVWENQILDRDFQLIESHNNADDESMFRKFLLNVCRGSSDRFNSLMSGIGYLLHSYKNPANAKAIIFCDEKVSETPEGRSGKSLVAKAIGQLKNTVRMDGKKIDFRDRFVYQQVELSTQIIDFNDVKENFDFESLFSVVTDAINVEKKNSHKYTIDFENAPKITISTNYTIRGVGGSFNARKFELEFSDYYNSEFTPYDDFKCMFFDGWDAVEWNKFDNFMLMCEQFYLQNGLVDYQKINLALRNIISNTSAEFVSYADLLTLDIWHDKKMIYDQYIARSSTNSRFLSQRRFTSIWLKTFADYKGYKIETRETNGIGSFRLCKK